MISIASAQQEVLNHVSHLAPASVPLLQGLGKVSFHTLHAPWDMPMASNAAMDGYAMAHRDGQGEWNVIDFIPAGTCRTSAVGPGEAVKIMTGAPIPPGCDTVIPFEQISREQDLIRPLHPVKPGSNIRHRGEDLRAGAPVVQAGTLLRPQEIGLLTAIGLTEVAVYRTPRIAVLATGDELLEPGSTPSPGKIINSNSNSLAAQLLEAGCEPQLIGVAADTRESTRAKISAGVQADALLITGGASTGDRDYVKETILELGGQLHFCKVNMKPGKPVAFGTLAGTPVFILPGNPVAAMVCFEMFVRPALLTMQGRATIMRPSIKAVLTAATSNRGDRPHLISVRVTRDSGIYTASSINSQSSANLAALTAGNGLLMVEPHATLPSDSLVEVTLLDRSLEMGDFCYAAL